MFPVVTMQTKTTDKYSIKVPDNDVDLHMQLYFTESFTSLTDSRKLFKLVSALSDKLSDENIQGEFSVEIIPQAQSVYIGSKGYWKDLTSNIENLVALVEKELNNIL